MHSQIERLSCKRKTKSFLCHPLHSGRNTLNTTRYPSGCLLTGTKPRGDEDCNSVCGGFTDADANATTYVHTHMLTLWKCNVRSMLWISQDFFAWSRSITFIHFEHMHIAKYGLQHVRTWRAGAAVPTAQLPKQTVEANPINPLTPIRYVCTLRHK